MRTRLSPLSIHKNFSVLFFFFFFFCSSLLAELSLIFSLSLDKMFFSIFPRNFYIYIFVARWDSASKTGAEKTREQRTTTTTSLDLDPSWRLQLYLFFFISLFFFSYFTLCIVYFSSLCVYSTCGDYISWGRFSSRHFFTLVFLQTYFFKIHDVLLLIIYFVDILRIQNYPVSIFKKQKSIVLKFVWEKS